MVRLWDKPSYIEKHFSSLPVPRPHCPAPPTTQLPGCLCRMFPKFPFLCLDWPILSEASAGRSWGCPITSGAGHKAKRKVQQPGGSKDAVVTAQWEQGAMATVWLGTAPKIAWGFPFLVCREQGSSMGAGTRLLCLPPKGVCVCGGGGSRGEQPEAQDCGKARLLKSPPPCFQGIERPSFLPWQGRSLLLGCYCTTLPPPQATDGPWAQGPIVRPAFAVSLACKYLLRAYCMPKFLSPQGAGTKPLPKLTLQLR